MASMKSLPLRLRPQLRAVARPSLGISSRASIPITIKLASPCFRPAFSHQFSTSRRHFEEPVVPPTELNSPQPLLPSFLVTPQALSNALRKNVYSKDSTLPKLIPLCATWFMPNDPQKRTGYDSYLQAHLPLARFFDIDDVCDKDSKFPHMLPTPEKFAQAMSKLGITPDDAVVVYDSAELGIFSAPRAAWTLKAFGHSKVHILNNFKIWVDQGFPVEKGEPEEKWAETSYPVPDLDVTKVINFEELRERIKEQKNEDAEPISVIDARSAERFDGTAPEPRPGMLFNLFSSDLNTIGLSSGHMPDAINIPFTDVLNARTKAFLPKEELRVYFECKGVDENTPIVTSCGTGVTAAVVDAALTEAGYSVEGRRLYDGSWTEWASRVEDADGLIVKKTKTKKSS
jgi:thiosulfate/3-mercaptopyruvate sulfurtransferase